MGESYRNKWKQLRLEAAILYEIGKLLTNDELKMLLDRLDNQKPERGLKRETTKWIEQAMVSRKLI